MQRDRQLRYWRGAFGHEYIARNKISDIATQQRTYMWKEILSSIDEYPKSILEVGSNVGLNLKALSEVTDASLSAVEPNESARLELKKNKEIHLDGVYDGSARALPFDDSTFDFVFTCGVLIHIDPDDLFDSCAEIYRVSRRYILSIEYFSSEPLEKRYRGEKGLLFLRDFGSFWIDNFPEVSCLDYGFFWKKTTGLDNLTWFLFEKN